jgi:phage terminase large subunit
MTSVVRRSRRETLFGSVARLAQRAAASAGSEGWEDYCDEPVRFFREVLGLEAWSKQAEIAGAVRDHDFVTVVSANGVGKSTIAAALALWYWRTRGPKNRVILTAPKFQQIAEIVWNEVRALYLRAKRPLGGSLAKLASTGLRDDDGRQLFGVTAQDVESFQGIRAPEMMVIADEASGIPEAIYPAIHGNLAGGGKLLLIGNGTKDTGYFFESHKSERYARIRISALESPNVVAGRVVVPGLVTSRFVEDAARMWGQTGAFYRIRVLGEFVEQQEGRLFPPSTIIESEQLWPKTPAEGRLRIGVDPAGAGGDGDESGFAARRGKKVILAHTRLGLTPDGHVAEVLGIISAHGGGGQSKQPPMVILDRDGAVGAKVYGAMLVHLAQFPNAFALVGIRGSEHAKRRPQEIDRVRDELWFGLVDAFREGLAIPVHVKLQGDLAAIRFDRLVNGRATVLKKPVIRRELGRSPDLGDALALCAYEPVDYSEMIESQLRSQAAAAPIDMQDAGYMYDQQSGNDIWWPEG